MPTAPDFAPTAGPTTARSPTAPDAVWAEALSALVDGEASAEEAQQVLQSMADGSSTRETWSNYQWIGQAMRAHDRPHEQADASFVAAVMEGIEREAAPKRLPVQTPATTRSKAQQTAANDDVFRWKMLAGVATLAAVGALAWQLVAAPVAGPQWAQTPANPQPPAAVATAGGQQLVQTEHGAVIRDAQLEALLAEHRQYGGVNAWQAPAGFLRNATYEAPQR